MVDSSSIDRKIANALKSCDKTTSLLTGGNEILTYFSNVAVREESLSWDNISDAIMFHGTRYPDRPAVIDGNDQINAAAFAALVGQAAVYLRGLGIAEGDLIGIALVNSINHLILFFGLLRIGATTLHIAPAGADAAVLVRRYDISAMFIEPDAPDTGAGQEIRIGLHWRDKLLKHHGDARTARDAAACLQVSLTSGSTGIPKGIVCTHRQRIARAEANERLYQGHWSRDRPPAFLLTMSICDAGFVQYLFNQVLMGGPVVILPYVHHPSDFVRMIAGHKDAVCVATPDMCRSFLAFAATAPERILLPGLRALISVGLPLRAEEKRRLARHVNPFFYDAYGTAGFGMVSALLPDEVADHAKTVGRPAAGAVVEVVDRNGLILPPGVAGQVRCRGPTMAQGWLADGKASLRGELFRDGYYYIGDIASIGADGYITLKGRHDDLIRRHRQEFHPHEVENVIAAHPLVREAAVTARPAASGHGSEIVAYVVLSGALPLYELASHCVTWLPLSKRPAKIIYAAALPRTPNGKLDRPAIRALAERPTGVFCAP
jgi:acyl-coenzyme A synthetase/AMP-(fatty) acid ligase